MSNYQMHYLLAALHRDARVLISTEDTFHLYFKHKKAAMNMKE